MWCFFAQTSSLILPIVLLLLPTFTTAQISSPNGTIVPFAILGPCASICGVLYDVQGACSPPVQATVNKTCFCEDKRLYAFATGSFNDTDTWGLCVNGLSSCSNKNMLGAIAEWYLGYCGGTTGKGTTTTTSLSGGVATVVGSYTWFSSDSMAETSFRSSRTGTLPWGVESLSVSGSVTETIWSDVAVQTTIDCLTTSCGCTVTWEPTTKGTATVTGGLTTKATSVSSVSGVGVTTSASLTGSASASATSSVKSEGVGRREVWSLWGVGFGFVIMMIV